MELHNYVPVTALEITDEKTNSTIAADRLHYILFGGDQLTRKHAETAKESRKNSVTPVTQLRGIIPVCEDWHAKKMFLEVIFCPSSTYTDTLAAWAPPLLIQCTVGAGWACGVVGWAMYFIHVISNVLYM